MGTFFTNMSFYSVNTTAEQIGGYFREILKASGFEEASDDCPAGAEVVLCRWLNSPWITVLCDLAESVSFSTLKRVARDASKALKTEVLTIACVDSDALAIWNVDEAHRQELSIAVGQTAELGIKVSNTYNAWKKKFGDSTELKRIVKTDYIFAEDALNAIAPLFRLPAEQAKLSAAFLPEDSSCEIQRLRFRPPMQSAAGRRYDFYMANFDEETQTALRNHGFQNKGQTWYRLTKENVFQVIRLGYDSGMTLRVFSEPLFGFPLEAKELSQLAGLDHVCQLDMIAIHEALRGSAVTKGYYVSLSTEDHEVFKTFPQYVRDIALQTMLPLLEEAATPSGCGKVHYRSRQILKMRLFGTSLPEENSDKFGSFSSFELNFYYGNYETILSEIRNIRAERIKNRAEEREIRIRKHCWTEENEARYEETVREFSLLREEEYALAERGNREEIQARLQMKFDRNRNLIEKYLGIGADAVLTFPEDLA